MRRYKELSTIKIREERIFCILLELFEVFEVGASINMNFDLLFTTTVSQKIFDIFPILMLSSSLNSSVVCQVRRRGGRMRYAPTFLPLIRWNYRDG